MKKQTEHASASLILRMEKDILSGKVEGRADDLKHMLAHAIENDKALEDIFLGALQMLAAKRISEHVEEAIIQQKLKKGSKVKN